MPARVVAPVAALQMAGGQRQAIGALAHRRAVGVALDVEAQLAHRARGPGERAPEHAAQLGVEQDVAVAAADVGALVGDRRRQLGVVEARERAGGDDERRVGETGGGEQDVVAADDDAALGAAASGVRTSRRTASVAWTTRAIAHSSEVASASPPSAATRVAGDLVVRRARPFGEGAQQVPGMQQHERAGHRATTTRARSPSERPTAGRRWRDRRAGARADAEGRSLRTRRRRRAPRRSSHPLRRDFVRQPAELGRLVARQAADELRDGDLTGLDEAPRSVCSIERDRYSASVSDGA
jgi:hypothetical protein